MLSLVINIDGVVILIGFKKVLALNVVSTVV